tara:strand:+ start:105389 stop:107743 length:2355 start_codon:yes stop_codon:yes gene_type:complete
MNNNILENKEFLNQLDFEHFINFFEENSNFPYFLVPHIFNQYKTPKHIKYSYKLTNFFISEENYDESQEIHFKLKRLKENNLIKLIDTVKKEGYVEAEELNLVILMVEYLLDHKTFLKRSEILELEPFEVFIKFFNKEIKREFRSFVDTEGNINFNNHPQLRSLNSELIKLENTIRSKLNEHKVLPEVAKTLQHDGIDVLNDRFVLAYKSDSYNSKIGSIVSRSESGRTLYIEPKHIREFNENRISLVLEIKALLDNLIKNIVKALSPYSAYLQMTYEVFLNFDEYKTKALFASNYHLFPANISNNFELKLDSLFHPLIKNPIKNTINIADDKFALVISGPNTGGKTALIKSICLAQLFFNFGLYIPARNGTLSCIKNIFYYGADQQNLGEGLSSFSSEVKNYNKLLKNLDESNLIVIDEIFNSTSSEEASALAISLFDYIKKNSSSKILVSTHHQTLKTLLHSNEEFISSHVGFDNETLKPTYKIHFGIPGSSQALEIFKSYSPELYTEEIYNNAIKFLDNKTIHYEKLLNKLAQKENKLDKTLRENTELNKELKNQKEASKGILNLKIQTELEKTKSKFEKIINEAYEMLDTVKKGNIKNKKHIYNAEAKAKNLFHSLEPTKEKEEIKSNKYDHLKPPATHEVGNKYYCTFINQTVTLQEINGKNAFITKGALRIKVPLDTLMETNLNPKSNDVKINFQSSSDMKIEYDCRGMRLSEFQNLVESALLDLESGNIPFLNIIHGHGEGILKKWLRDFVKKNKGIEQLVNESGNDGETKIVLKTN